MGLPGNAVPFGKEASYTAGRHLLTPGPTTPLRIKSVKGRKKAVRRDTAISNSAAGHAPPGPALRA